MNKLLCLRSICRAVLPCQYRPLTATASLNKALTVKNGNVFSTLSSIQSAERTVPQISTGIIQLSTLMSSLSLGGGISTQFLNKQVNMACRPMSSLSQLHKNGPHKKKSKKKRPLDGRPFMKGVVLKTLIKKPRKPNSANRKCVLVRLSNGKEMTAYVPGEGHNLQEHNVVLVRCGRLQDTPGVWLKVVRGKFDCAHVIKRTETSK
ncbi:37S ribosomal protein S12, mitochondrial [Chamberlinius hualienensis]